MTLNRISIAAILVMLISAFGTAPPARAQDSASSTIVDASGKSLGQSPSGQPAAAPSGQTQSGTATPTPSPNNQPAITAMTSREKLHYGLYEAFLTPGAYVGPAVNAYFVERRDVKALGKTGEDKFADGLSRFGRAFTTRATAELLGAGVFPALFKQNPIYEKSGKQGFMPRMAYAASRALVTSGDNGKAQPNFSRLLGNLTSASMANLYERDTVKRRDRFGRVLEYNRRVGVRPTLESFAISTGFEALTHVLFDEFNIVKKILKVP